MIDNSYYSQEVHGPYDLYDIGSLNLEEGGTTATPKCVRPRASGDIRHWAMQFADSAFRFLTSLLRKGPVLGFIAVCIGVGHHDHCQRPLTLFSVRNDKDRLSQNEMERIQITPRSPGQTLA